jgi:hypothetical protein
LALKIERLGKLPDDSEFETAIVVKVLDRAVDVFVPCYRIEKRVWIEDLVYRGLAQGCAFNEERGSLKIHWSRESVKQEIFVFM